MFTIRHKVINNVKIEFVEFEAGDEEQYDTSKKHKVTKPNEEPIFFASNALATEYALSQKCGAVEVLDPNTPAIDHEPTPDDDEENNETPDDEGDDQSTDSETGSEENPPVQPPVIEPPKFELPVVNSDNVPESDDTTADQSEKPKKKPAKKRSAKKPAK